MTSGSERDHGGKDPSEDRAVPTRPASTGAAQDKNLALPLADPRLVPSLDTADPAFGRARKPTGPVRPITSLQDPQVTNAANPAKPRGDEADSPAVKPPRNESVLRAEEEFGFTTRDISEPLAYVEGVFGVKLPEDKIPALVVLDPENEKKLRELAQDKKFELRQGDLDDAAWQDERYNILFLGINAFTKKDTVIHEAGHPVIDYINPRLLEVFSQRKEAMEAVRAGKEPPEVAIEESAISQVVQEGVMTWIQIESLDSEKEKQKARNRLYTGKEHDGRAIDLEEFVDYGFNRLESGVEILRNGIEERDINEVRRGNLAERDRRYKVGHFLVDSMMNQLQEEGASDDERRKVLVGFIQNPPQTIAECRDPRTYLQKLRTQLEAQAEATQIFAVESHEVPKDKETQLREAIALLAPGETPNLYLTDAQNFALGILDQARRMPEKSRERNEHIDALTNAVGTHAIATGNSELAQRIFDLLSPADRWLLYATAYTADKPDKTMLDNWWTELMTNMETGGVLQDPFDRAARSLAIAEIELHNYASEDKTVEEKQEAYENAVQSKNIFNQQLEAFFDQHIAIPLGDEKIYLRDRYVRRLRASFVKAGVWREIEDFSAPAYENRECTLIGKALAGDLEKADLKFTTYRGESTKSLLRWLNDTSTGKNPELPKIESLDLSYPALILLETVAPELIGQIKGWTAISTVRRMKLQLAVGNDSHAQTTYAGFTGARKSIDKVQAALLMGQNQEKKLAQERINHSRTQQVRELVEGLHTGETPNPYFTDAVRFAEQILDQAKEWPEDRSEHKNRVTQVANILGTYAIDTEDSELAERIFQLLPPADRWLMYAAALTSDKFTHRQLNQWHTELFENAETVPATEDAIVRSAFLVAYTEISLHLRNEDGKSEIEQERLYDDVTGFAGFIERFKKNIPYSSSHASVTHRDFLIQRQNHEVRLITALVKAGLWKDALDISTSMGNNDIGLIGKSLAGEMDEHVLRNFTYRGETTGPVLCWISNQKNGILTNTPAAYDFQLSEQARRLLETVAPELIEQLEDWRPTTTVNELKMQLGTNTTTVKGTYATLLEEEPFTSRKLEATLIMAHDHEKKAAKEKEINGKAQRLHEILTLLPEETPNTYLTDAVQFAIQMIEDAKIKTANDPEFRPDFRQTAIEGVSFVIANHAITTHNEPLAEKAYELLSSADKWIIYAKAYEAGFNGEKQHEWREKLDHETVTKTLDAKTIAAQHVALIQIALLNAQKPEQRVASLLRAKAHKDAFLALISQNMTNLTNAEVDVYNQMLKIAFAKAGRWREVGDFVRAGEQKDRASQLTAQTLAGELDGKSIVRARGVRNDTAEVLQWVDNRLRLKDVNPPDRPVSLPVPVRAMLGALAPKLIKELTFHERNWLRGLKVDLANGDVKSAYQKYMWNTGLRNDTIEPLAAALLMSQHQLVIAESARTDDAHYEAFRMHIKPIETTVAEYVNPDMYIDLRPQLREWYDQLSSKEMLEQLTPQQLFLARARLARLYQRAIPDSGEFDEVGNLLRSLQQTWTMFEQHENSLEQLPELVNEMRAMGYTFIKRWKSYGQKSYVGYEPVLAREAEDNTRGELIHTTKERIVRYKEATAALNELHGEKRYVISESGQENKWEVKGLWTNYLVYQGSAIELHDAASYLEAYKQPLVTSEASNQLEQRLDAIMTPLLVERRNEITPADTIVVADRLESQAQIPTLTYQEQIRLEQNRFVMTQESLEGMDRIQIKFQELQQQYPHLQGLAFFGSRKTGTEKAGSDYDVVVFYDSSTLNATPDNTPSQQWLDIIDALNNSLGGSHLDEAVREGGLLQVDMNPETTQRDLDNFIALARPYINQNITEDTIPDILINTSVDHLIFRFFLTSDDAVIQSRKDILTYLKKIPDGEKYFHILVTVLSDFDRPTYSEFASKLTLPRFQHMPKTIAEAEEYFLAAETHSDTSIGKPQQPEVTLTPESRSSGLTNSGAIPMVNVYRGYTPEEPGYEEVYSRGFTRFLENMRQVFPRLASLDTLLAKRIAQAKKSGRDAVVVELGSGVGNIAKDFLANPSLGSLSRAQLEESDSTSLRFLSVTDAQTVQEHLQVTPVGSDGKVKAQEVKYSIVSEQPIRKLLEHLGIQSADAFYASNFMQYLQPQVFEAVIRDVIDVLEPGGQFMAFGYSGIGGARLSADNDSEAKDYPVNFTIRNETGEHTISGDVLRLAGQEILDDENIDDEEVILTVIGIHELMFVNARYTDEQIKKYRLAVLNRFATESPRDVLAQTITQLLPLAEDEIRKYHARDQKNEILKRLQEEYEGIAKIDARGNALSEKGVDGFIITKL